MEILFILPGFILAIIIVVIYKIKLRKLQNKVRFYVARDKERELTLWMGKPKRLLEAGKWYGYNEITYIATNSIIRFYNLNPKDFDNLKWEDEPIEVFLNMEKNEKDKE